LRTRVTPSEFIIAQKKKLVVKAVDYHLIVGNLYNLGTNDILWQCVLEHERPMILSEAHEGIAGDHYVGKTLTKKILHMGIWRPNLHMDAKELC
jgi:hypothetical protein